MSDDNTKGRTHRVRRVWDWKMVEVSDEVARRDFPHLFRTPANHLDTEARHVVDMVHGLLDEAHAAEGPLVERVRGVLAQVACRTMERNDAESTVEMLRKQRDEAVAERNTYRCQVNALLTTDAAMVGELIDIIGDGCLPSEVVGRVRTMVSDLRATRASMHAARDDAREARAIVTRVRLLLQDLLAAGGES